MPTVRREGPYRFFFYAGDRTEPEHVHVERDDRVAKFWLAPVRLQRSGGMRRREIRRLARMIEEHEAEFLEAWHEYFDD